MNKVKIEAFLSVPTCSGGVNLSRLLEEIKKEYGSRVDIVTRKGRDELFEKYNLTTAPALVIGGLVRIMGLCPSKESLISALKEAGLE
ncbi:MAG: thioredoxin family protein [Dehalococcoidales bacterium]|nr:thioredoxin family protein [Dehalococcoidales bacterium]